MIRIPHIILNLLSPSALTQFINIMATGLWNIGGINLPDLGISEALSNWTGNDSNGGLFNGAIQNNAAVYNNQPQALNSNNPVSQNLLTQAQNYGTLPSAPSTPSIPRSASVPVSQPQQSSSGLPTYNGQPDRSNPVYDKMWSDYLNSQNQNNNGGGGNNDIMNQIDSMYGPTMDALNQQEGVAAGYQATDTNQSNLNKAQSLQSLMDQYDSSMALIGGNESKLSSAAQQARDLGARNYTQLQNQAMSRYGTGSSAGGAISELLKNEYLRGSFGVETNYQDQLATLQSQAVAFKKASDEGSKYIQSQSQIELQKINDAFKKQMADISLIKGQTEAAKTQQKIQILQDSVNQTRAVAAQKQSMADSLAMFKQQTDYTIASGLAKIQSNPNYAYQGITSQINLPQQGTQAASYDPNAVYNPNQKRYDQWGNLIS